MKRSPSPRRALAKPAQKKQLAPKKRSNWLAHLEDAELVRRANESGEAYMFKHALTQESAYTSLLNRTRRAIHLDVARVYENLFPQQLDEYAALLAQHYAEAGEDAKALEYATRAGDAATRVYANAEAIAHYSRAIELALRLNLDSARIIFLFLARGRLCELKGEYESALDNYRALHALARERNDRAMELSALIATLPIYAVPTTAHDPDMAKMISARALDLARELGDRAAESKILWSLMLFTRWIGDPADALRFGEESLMIARENNLREQLAFTLNDLGLHGYLDNGKYLVGLERVREAQAMWREMNNLPMLADNYGGVALLSYPLGRREDVFTSSSEAIRISESIESLWGQSFARWVLGPLYSDLGELDRAVTVMEECIQLGKLSGFIGAEVGIGIFLAFTLVNLGIYGRGLQIIDQAVELARTKFAAWLVWAQAVHAYCLARSGKMAEAESTLAIAQTLSEPRYIGKMFGLFSFHLIHAEIEIAFAKNNRQFDRIHARLNQLIEFHTASNALALLPDLYLLQGRLLMAQENFESAFASLQRAQEIAEPLLHRRTLWQVYALLSEIAQRRGDADAALGFREQARRVVDYIAQHANEEQRNAFLSLENVKQVLARV